MYKYDMEVVDIFIQIDFHQAVKEIAQFWDVYFFELFERVEKSGNNF